MTSVDRSIRIRPLKPATAINGKTLPLLAEDLEQILPHRGSLALVDRVDVLDAGSRAVGRHLVPRNDPLLEGHFPGRPIVPGVLLIEALAQLAGVVVWSAHDPSGAARPPFGVLAGVKRFRFRRLVVPGDVVELEVTCTARIGGLSEFRATARVDRELAAEGVVQLALRA